MTTINKTMFNEGHSIDRPPMFCGENFDLWRLRIETFFKSIDMRLWFIVKNGPYEALIEDNDTHIMRPNTIDELTPQDLTKLSLNAKAMHILYSSLNANESSRLEGLSSAKEMWENLKRVHEGSNDIKEHKKAFLVSKYETFKMAPHESIDDMYIRFTSIIKDLEALGKIYSLSEKNRKILNALSKEWETKTMAIEEAKDLSSLSLESLVNSLLSFELKLYKGKALDESKRSEIAFKALKCLEEESDETSSSSEEGDAEIITQGVKHLIIKTKRKHGNSNQSAKHQKVKCYICGQREHYAHECPSQRNKKKFTNLKLAWDESEDDEEEGETSHLALMANNNEVHSSPCCSNSCSNQSNEEVGEYEIMVLELHDSLKYTLARNKELRAKNKALLNANSKLIGDLETQKSLHKALVEKYKFYKNMLSEHEKIRKRIDDLGSLLKNEKENFVKKNVSKHISMNKYATFFNNGVCFIKSCHVEENIQCLFCHQHGHKKKNYYVKRNIGLGLKGKWLRKNKSPIELLG